MTVSEGSFQACLQAIWANDCGWYEGISVQLWQGYLIARNRHGIEIKREHVGCRGDACNKLRQFLSGLSFAEK